MQAGLHLITLAGSLALLAYSLLIFSDGLQRIGGNWGYHLVARPRRNSFSLLGRGFALTSIFQSPSAAVQMIAGLLNSGLLDLRAALIMVAGANMGSLIILLFLFFLSLVANKMHFVLASILVLGYFIFRLGRRQAVRGLGKALVGIGLVGVGLHLNQHIFLELKPMLSSLQGNWQSLALIYILGFFIVALFRSPALSYALVFLLIDGFHIHLPLFFLMGSLLARSVGLLISTSNGNIYARRVVILHLFFGLLASALFFITVLIAPSFAGALGELIPLGIYTVLMILTSLGFIMAKNSLLELVKTMVSESDMPDEKHLEVLGDPRDMAPMTALVLAQRQVSKLQDIVNRMFLLTKQYLDEQSNRPRAMAKLKDYERITDNVKREITTFIQHLGQKPLAAEQSARAHSLLRIADELESVADYLDKMAIYATGLRENWQWNPEIRRQFMDYFGETYDFFLKTSGHIDPAKSMRKDHLEELGEQAFQLKRRIEETRREHASLMGNEGVSPALILSYSDMLVALRKVRSHTRNIGEAIP